jgi:hypothetical protein
MKLKSLYVRKGHDPPGEPVRELERIENGWIPWLERIS